MASHKKKASRLGEKFKVISTHYRCDREFIQPNEIEIFCKISDCLESLTDGMVGIKQLITENDSQIYQLRENTEMQTVDCNQILSDISDTRQNNKTDRECILLSPTQNSAQRKYAGKKEEVNDQYENTKLQSTMSLLDEQSQVNHDDYDKQVLRVNTLVASMPLMPTNDAMEARNGKKKCCSNSEECHEALLTLLKQLEEEKDKSKQLEETNLTLGAQVKLLVSKIHEKNTKDSVTVTEQLQGINDRCDHLWRENTSLRELLEKEVRNAANFTAASQDMKFKNEKLNESLKITQTELKEAREYIEQARDNEKITGNLKEQVNGVSYQYLTSKLKLLEEDRQRLQARIKAKTDEAETLKGEIMKKAFLESHVAELEEKYRKLEQTTEHATDNDSSRKSKIRLLEGELSTLQQERDHLQLMVRDANAEKVSANKLYNDTKKELKKTVIMKNQLTNALHEAVQEKSNNENVNVKLDKSIEEIEKENKELLKSFSAMKEVKGRLESENASFKANILDLKKQNNRFQENLFGMKIQKERYIEETVSLRKKVKETLEMLRMKEIKNDEKINAAKKYSTELEVVNEKLKKEVMRHNERLTSHDQLRRQSKIHLEQLEKCKGELVRMRKVEIEHKKQFNAVSCECQRLNEQISYLEQAKLKLEYTLERSGSIENNDICNTINQLDNDGQTHRKLKIAISELQTLIGQYTDIKADSDPEKVVGAVYNVLESKNSEIEEFKTAVCKLKQDIDRLSRREDSSGTKEEEERGAQNRGERCSVEPELDLDSVNHTTVAAANVRSDDKAFQEQAPGKKEMVSRMEGRISKNDNKRDSLLTSAKKSEVLVNKSERKTGKDCFSEEMKIEDIGMEETSDLFDDHLAVQSGKRANTEKHTGCLPGNDGSNGKQEFRAYIPSAVCIATKDLPSPSPSLLAPLTKEGSSLHSCRERKSSLGPLPPIENQVKIAKKSKTGKKRAKNKERRGNETLRSNKISDLSQEKISKAFVFEDNEVEFTNDEIAYLLDNF